MAAIATNGAGAEVVQLIRDSRDARHANETSRAVELADSALDIAETRLPGLYGHPEAYFTFYRAVEADGDDEKAADGFAEFWKRFSYQTWTPPLRLRAETRLIACGTRLGNEALVERGRSEGHGMFGWVFDLDLRVEYWHRTAIWAMESGRFDTAEALFQRCASYQVHDERYAVSARLASASLLARQGEEDGALDEFNRASFDARTLNMVRADRVAGGHLRAALQN